MSGHTPGPWRVSTDEECSGDFGIMGPSGEYVVHGCGCCGSPGTCAEANIPLIAAAPELLAEVEDTYAFLADISNQWPGRHGAEGQARLCRLRDLICKVTGRDPQDVQDDYGNRRLRDRVATSIRATHGHKGGS
jgi:hypothetical protein